MTTVPSKPLGRKAYGSIPHLIGSRRGPSDAGVNDGQQRICTERTRDRHDEVIVTLKLDGSNVAIANVDGAIVALTRAGYLASDSPYRQHHLFAEWVAARTLYYQVLLRPGQRISGEWLAQAHGTRYDLTNRSPFVAFDLWVTPTERASYDLMIDALTGHATVPLIHRGMAMPVDSVMEWVHERLYGELDAPEGAVWRVERKGKVDFLAKYVQPDKIDGCYLESVSGGDPVWNWPVGV